MLTMERRSVPGSLVSGGVVCKFIEGLFDELFEPFVNV
jgi:hypothetical protein